MENKVGDNLPSSADLEKLVKQLDGLIRTLRKFCINLSPEERQSLTRGRRGVIGGFGTLLVSQPPTTSLANLTFLSTMLVFLIRKSSPRERQNVS